MLTKLISIKSQSQVHEQGEAYVTPMGCHLTMPGSTHITVIKLHMLRTQNWERLRWNLLLVLESAPTSSRRRGDRASERGSPLLNLLRSQVDVESSWAIACKYIGRIVDIICAWLIWDYSSPNCTTMCPSGAAINIKKNHWKVWIKSDWQLW